MTYILNDKLIISSSMSKEQASTFLRLPVELRLQIYEHVIGRRVVYVRMSWTGVCIPSGFFYNCLNDTHPLLESLQKTVLAKCVPFGASLTVLSQICRQMHEETAILPFQCYIWAFETPWTLDQFISMKRTIPEHHKKAIRIIAVPSPGPYQSNERVLSDLHTILLVGSYKHDSTSETTTMIDSESSRKAILALKRAKGSSTWLRSDGYA